MSVYFQLKGKLSELRRKRGELAIKADAAIKAIKNLLATASIEDLSDVDAEGVASLAADLRAHREDYVRLGEDIRKLERELGNE